MFLRRATLLNLFPALAQTTNANGTGQDLQPYVNSGGREMKAYLDVGAVSGTAPTLDVKIQESDALGSGYTDITGAVFAQKTTLGNEAIHFVSNKRYIRAVATFTGTTPSFTFGVYLVAEARKV